MSKKFSLVLLLPLLLSCSFMHVNTTVDVTNKNGLTFSTYRNYASYHDLPSTGESKILVIPVVFTDCTLSETQLEEEHTRIENSFFGTFSDTYWESVSSFYQKSSYGKLNITGKVSDYYYYSATVVKANSVYYTDNQEPTIPILRSALSWYKENNDDYLDYDTDGDGYIDSVWLIYMEDYYETYLKRHPTYSRYENITTFLWAYTYWDQYSSPNVNSPTSYSYAWASYKFSYEGSSSSADAHTYIHETGHLLGLDDYYNYDYSSSDTTRPVGGLDMMDLNILDHNAFSKYLLNWIEPRVIGESGTYTLNNFQETGDAIIIPSSSWNGSPLDEYLILELYTPTGLNQQDSETSYTGNYPKGFSKYGVKIYHVDARLGKYKIANNIYFDSYASSPNDLNSLKKNYYLKIANSNTPSRSADSDNKLITLISATGASDTYYSSRSSSLANDSDLFKDGSYLKSFTFNQYYDINLLIEIDNVTSSSCEVTISGIGK